MRVERTSAGAPLLLTAAFLCTFATGAVALPEDPGLDRALALHESGRSREAVAALREIGRARAASDPALAAEALSDACAIAGGMGDFRATLPDCRRAVSLAKGTRLEDLAARALNNLGLALQALGQPGEARGRFAEALALNRRAGDGEAEAINLGNLGALALETGSYEEALRLYREGATLAARHRSEEWAAEQGVIARVNQGVALERIGAYREALEVYRGLLSAGESLDPRWRASLLVNAGVLYRNLGDPVAAVEDFRQAVDLYRHLDDLSGLSNAQLNLGLAAHLNLARPREAEAAYGEALRLARQGGDRGEEVRDLFYLGRMLLDQGRLDEAERTYRACFAAARASDSAEGAWSCREGLGRTAAARGDLRGALTWLEGAIDEIERLRSSIAGTPRRAGYFGDKRAVYAAAVDVLARLALAPRPKPDGTWAARALEVAERAKARDLLDALGSSRRSGINAGRPLSAAALVQLAGHGTVFDYFLGEDHLYLWVIRRTGIRMLDLGPKAPLLAAAARVRASLARNQEPESADLKTLSQSLLTEAFDAPLLISPDGLLHYLPFELLPDPAPGNRRALLLDRTAVAYLPSASTLARLRSPRSEPALQFAGFAAASEPAAGALGAGLPPLPSAGHELAAVARQLGGRSLLLTGPRATTAAFRRTVASGARVVHVATHTLIDERRDHGTAILFSPAGGDDGLLHPEDIAALDDRSDLTVLAACSTALPAGTAAEGPDGDDQGRALSSLTGAFLAAGSPAVVATLWDVGDRETAVFMEQLYHQLGRGLAPAEALRRAKLRLRADPRWDRPSLWAGYVLVGEGRPVAPRWTGGKVAAGILAAVLFFGLGVWGWRTWRARAVHAARERPS